MSSRYVNSSLVTLIAATILGACASAPVAPHGMVAGKFVNFACTGGRFSARAAEDGKSLRIRGLHGAAELDLKGDGIYEGDGYKLVTKGANGISLTHDGKPNGTHCKVA